MSSQNASKKRIFVDAHVHIHPCFHIEQLFDSVRKNFTVASKRLRNNFSSNGVLLLSESRGVSVFRDLRKYAKEEIGSHQLERWQVVLTDEDESIVVRSEGEENIVIVAGRQIITKENLEVLALATAADFSERLSLRKTVARVIDAGAIPVLPWGVGKWLGGRGSILNQFIKENRYPNVFLGDNGGRPCFWGMPSHFRLGQDHGFKILPGSDPLPLPSEYWRPGSFGSIIEGDVTLRSPAQHIKDRLKKLHKSPERYGDLEGPIRFLKHQLLMHLRKVRSKE